MEIKLNYRSFADTIKWEGQPTNGCLTWVAYGTSFKDIWDLTVEREVNNLDSEFDFVMKKIGKTETDYLDENGEIDIEKQIDEFYTYKIGMTDDEYRELLLQSIGNAYYQEIYYLSEESSTESEVD